MCGIAGIIYFGSKDNLGEQRLSLDKMLEIQVHRGPDDYGVWLGTSGSHSVLLGHRRLSILDLTSSGHQPMISPCGRYVLVYNGELYNYKELRLMLKKIGCIFTTQTDTEVVLHALIQWGNKAFECFNGMWALAFFDSQMKTILLSRDRFGEKPLYYYRNGRAIYFASEIKAICVGSGDLFSVNPVVTSRFLAQSLYEAQDETFFSGVSKVTPGHYLVVSVFGEGLPSIGEPEPYWSLPTYPQENGNIGHLAETLKDLFIDAVQLRLRSDVPVGVLLSGGIDSSAIASVMKRISPHASLNLFSAVNEYQEFSEEPYIDIMGRYLDHPINKLRLRFNDEEGFQKLERAIWYNDEPFCGFSIVVNMMLMERARESGVTVLLSGQGADELLCGYNKYYGFYLKNLISKRRYWHFLTSTVEILWNQLAYMPDFRLAEARRYLPTFLQRQPVNVLGPRIRESKSYLDIQLGHESIQSRQALDLSRFSLPAITHYEDRMSMSASREVRLPFLDHRIVSLLLPLNPELKLKDGWSKWIFRTAMQDMLPSEISWRKDKRGFSNPIEKWLRKEWYSRIKSLLSDKLIAEELGLINKGSFEKVYQVFLQKKDRWIGVKDVFNLLSLELWAQQYRHYLSG